MRVLKVVKWGNSLAVRLPADLVAAMGWKAGDDLDIRAAKDPRGETRQSVRVEAQRRGGGPGRET